jgi:hypothetical protein
MKKRIGALILAFVMVLGMGTVAPAAAADTPTASTAIMANDNIQLGALGGYDMTVSIPASTALTVQAIDFTLDIDPNLVYEKDIAVVGKPKAEITSTTDKTTGVTTYTWVNDTAVVQAEDASSANDLFTLRFQPATGALTSDYKVKLTIVQVYSAYTSSSSNTTVSTEKGNCIESTFKVTGADPITIDLAESQTVTYGTDVSLAAKVTFAQGAEGTVTYTWTKGVDTVSDAAGSIAGAKTSTLSLTKPAANASAGDKYKLTVTSVVTVEDAEDSSKDRTYTYTASAETTLVVNKFDLSKATSIVVKGGSLAYTGAVQTPDFVATMSDGTTVTLTSSDVTVTYTQGSSESAVTLKDVGTYTASFSTTDSANYTGTVTAKANVAIVKKAINVSNVTLDLYYSDGASGVFNKAKILEAMGFDALSSDEVNAITLTPVAANSTNSYVQVSATPTITLTTGGDESVSTTMTFAFAETDTGAGIKAKFNVTGYEVTCNLTVNGHVNSDKSSAVVFAAKNGVDTSAVKLTYGMKADSVVGTPTIDSETESSFTVNTPTYTLEKKVNGSYAVVKSGDAELKDKTDLTDLTIDSVGEYRVTTTVTDSTNHKTGTKSIEFTVVKGEINLGTFDTTFSSALTTAATAKSYTGKELEYTLTDSDLGLSTQTSAFKYLHVTVGGVNKATNVGEYKATLTFTVDNAQSDNWTIVGGKGANKNTLTETWTIVKAADYGKVLSIVDADTITVYAGVAAGKTYTVKSSDLAASLIAAGFDGAYVKAVKSTSDCGDYATLFSGAAVTGSTDRSKKDDGVLTLTAKASLQEKEYYIVVQFESNNYTLIEKNVKVVVAKYDDVSSQIVKPSTAPSYTYTGYGQEIAAVDGAYMKGAGVSDANLSYTYAANGGTASLDSNNLPKTIGNYTVTINYLDDANQKFGTASWTMSITAAKLTITGYELSSRAYVKGNVKVASDATAKNIKVIGLLGSDTYSDSDFNVIITNGVYDSDEFGARTVSGVYFTLKNTSKLATNYVLNADQENLTGTSSITGAVIANFSVTAKDTKVAYTGDYVKPELVFKGGTPAAEMTLVEGTDYTVTTTAKDVGSAYVTVSPVEGSQYSFDTTRVYFTIVATELTADNLTLSGVEYTIGTEPSLAGVKATFGETTSTIAGSFADLTADQIAQIKALADGEKADITVTFTPDASAGFGTTPITKTLTVTAKAAADQNPGESESPAPTTPGTDDSQKPGTGDNNTAENDTLVENTVTVVLKSYTIKYTGKEVKPSVTVYTDTGAKLSSKLYTVTYDDDHKTVGDKSLTVKLNTSGYTFTDGDDTATVKYQIVEKSNGLVLTAKTKAVSFGTDPVITGTVKQGTKTVSKTVDYNLDDLRDADGKIPAGVYSVAVTGTYGDDSVVGYVLVTVKPTKVTAKAAKVSYASGTELDADQLAEDIKANIIANSKGTLTEDDFDVEITGTVSGTLTKTAKVAYKVVLTNENLSFSTAVGNTSKEFKATVKVAK